jgi:hypothetical protein
VSVWANRFKDRSTDPRRSIPSDPAVPDRPYRQSTGQTSSWRRVNPISYERRNNLDDYQGGPMPGFYPPRRMGVMPIEEIIYASGQSRHHIPGTTQDGASGPGIPEA